MNTFTITLSDVELVALTHVMADPEQWAQNAITERARIASEELVARETARMIADPNITTIPATAAEIVMAAELPQPLSTELPIPSEA
jgi:hypothetical protein